MSAEIRPIRPSDGFRVLDPKGCLTLEVLCFSEQLTPDQRRAVERHVRSCSICAQQQTALARASERFRRGRPRQATALELRLVARQAAVRALAERRERASTTAQLPTHGAAEPWYRSRTFWVALLAGMGTALALVLLAMVVL